MSAVLHACGQPEACIAHCPLGPQGAHALAHALTCNTVITSLTLRDNNLDEQVSYQALIHTVQITTSMSRSVLKPSSIQY